MAARRSRRLRNCRPGLGHAHPAATALVRRCVRVWSACELAAGQTLSIPRLTLNANNADTFQPYDPSRITGSTDPMLPAPAAQGGSGCGGLGKIIMVAVAVVAAVYTAGALAPAAASAGTGFGATMTTGASVLGGGASLSTGSAFAIGAASGAAGSIASQAAGNLLGMQDGFSWKGVALSALSAGVSGGLTTSSLLGGSSLDKLLLRAMH